MTYRLLVLVASVWSFAFLMESLSGTYAGFPWWEVVIFNASHALGLSALAIGLGMIVIVACRSASDGGLRQAVVTGLVAQALVTMMVTNIPT